MVLRQVNIVSEKNRESVGCNAEAGEQRVRLRIKVVDIHQSRIEAEHNTCGSGSLGNLSPMPHNSPRRPTGGMPSDIDTADPPTTFATRNQLIRCRNSLAFSMPFWRSSASFVRAPGDNLHKRRASVVVALVKPCIEFDKYEIRARPAA